MTDLCAKNCKILMKEIKEDTNKWKDIMGPWIRFKVKMFILPKAVYRFSAVPNTNPMAFFREIEKKNPKICL